jgi:hypothetical protein
MPTLVGGGRNSRTFLVTDTAIKTPFEPYDIKTPFDPDDDYDFDFDSDEGIPFFFNFPFYLSTFYFWVTTHFE